MRQALVDPRIARMVRRDRQAAAASVIALWLLFAFVSWQVTRLMSQAAPGFVALSVIIGTVVVVLNTVSVYVMIRRYSSEAGKARIYGPEVYQCDQVQDCALPDLDITQRM